MLVGRKLEALAAPSQLNLSSRGCTETRGAEKTWHMHTPVLLPHKQF